MYSNQIMKLVYKQQKVDTYLQFKVFDTRMDAIELTHCHKKERVTIFKMPALSQSKGYYLDDWKQMIWQGGVKVTQKSQVLKVIFIQKSGKVFAQTQIPSNFKQAIAKTQDSSRGYAVRLKKPTGGFLWVGVAFRDRNDAFDFGVVFQQYTERNLMSANPAALQQQFGKQVDFSIKKGEKIKINVNSNPKKGQNTNADFFSDFNFQDKQPQKKEQKKKTSSDQMNWFGDFGNSTNKTKVQTKPSKKQPQNLLDL